MPTYNSFTKYVLNNIILYNVLHLNYTIFIDIVYIYIFIYVAVGT